MGREKGIVKWFSTEKGYGFIRRESGDEIFVHHTDIDVEGYASLKNGESVEFDVFESDRGPKARRLVPLDDRGRPVGNRQGRSTVKGARTGNSPTGGKRTLAEQIRHRLGGRFPGMAG